MNLYKLAFTCYIYNSFTDFNNSYKAFQKDIDYRLELYQLEHRKSLIGWLNKWGCRQFACNYHGTACDEILAWYQEGHIEMIPQNKKLWKLKGKELEQIAGIYDALAGKIASYKVRDDKLIPITVGPTGASKILFALRPEIAPPWDETIRIGLGHDGSGASYVDFLRRVINEIEDLTVSCKKNNIELLQVPQLIGRTDSTIAQLIGEYFWVTETRKCYPPASETIQVWARWS